MACCVFTAYFMNRLIKACEVLNLNLIESQYNKFDDGPNSNDAYAVPNDLVISKFSIEGMTCSACTSAIDNAVAALKGVERVSVSLPLARATVVHYAGQTTVYEILSAIEAAGYHATPGDRTASEKLEHAQQTCELDKLKAAFGSAMTLSSIIATLDWLKSFDALRSCQQGLDAAIIVLAAYVVLVDASWIHHSAFAKGLTSPTMDTLISLSLLLGLALSFFNIYLFALDKAQTYFSSSSFLTLVIIGGRYLDHLLRRRSAANLSNLYRLQIETTMVRIRSQSNASGTVPETTMMPCALLRPGDEIILPPATIVPIDSYILSGTSMIDTSTMTGEFLPRKVSPGDFLMSGTRNLSYEVIAVVTQDQEASALEKLVESISTATESSSSVDTGSSADRLTAYFVPAILLLALTSFAITLLSSSLTLPLAHRINAAAARAITVLASACPCAIGLAAPSVVMAAVDVAYTRGVIIKGGLPILEALSRLKTLVCDKTGTLTTGELAVVGSLKPGVGLEADRLQAWQALAIAAAEQSEAQRHPVAKAIWRWAFAQLDEVQRAALAHVQVKDQKSELGKGISCSILLPHNAPRWTTIVIGTAAFLAEHGIAVPPQTNAQPATDADSSTTLVHIALNDTHLTTLQLHDTVRPNAVSVLSTLQSSFGVHSTILTGDVPTESARVSRVLGGIPVLASGVLPAEKAAFINSLKANTADGCGEKGNGGADNTNHRVRNGSMHGTVAMLGDGLNDAAALAVADVGIYLSPSLSSAATAGTTSGNSALLGTTATVTLTSPNLSRLLDLLTISNTAVRAARYMRLWAVVYNIVIVTLALGVGERWGLRIDASIAGMCMAASSCSVMLGGILVRWKMERSVQRSDE